MNENLRACPTWGSFARHHLRVTTHDTHMVCSDVGSDARCPRILECTKSSRAICMTRKWRPSGTGPLGDTEVELISYALHKIRKPNIFHLWLHGT